MHKMVKTYRENLPVPHEGKRVRRFPSHTGWGARFLGVRGVAMAPPEKTLAQMVLTMCLVKLSIAPLLFFQVVMGGWIFIFLFRRPLFSCFFAVFRAMKNVGEDGMRVCGEGVCGTGVCGKGVCGEHVRRRRGHVRRGRVGWLWRRTRARAASCGASQNPRTCGAKQTASSGRGRTRQSISASIARAGVG